MAPRISADALKKISRHKLADVNQVTLYLRSGGSPNGTCTRIWIGHRPTLFDVITFFLSCGLYAVGGAFIYGDHIVNGLSFYARFGGEGTYLHWAVFLSDTPDIAMMLLDAGAVPSAQTTRHYTAYDIAKRMRRNWPPQVFARLEQQQAAIVVVADDQHLIATQSIARDVQRAGALARAHSSASSRTSKSLRSVVPSPPLLPAVAESPLPQLLLEPPPPSAILSVGLLPDPLMPSEAVAVPVAASGVM